MIWVRPLALVRAVWSSVTLTLFLVLSLTL